MATTKKKTAELTQARLRQVLSYDAATGQFLWIRQVGPALAGQMAGWYRPDGYLVIGLGGRLHYAHRLAWLYTHGQWPAEQLDHINGDPGDNRITNLRECTNAENCQNLGVRKSNTSGATGVYWDAARSKWKAQIRDGGKVRGLGRFETFEAAERAYLSAKSASHQFQPTPRASA